MLSLKLLGGASLERAGTPVTGRGTRGHRLALLALLARGRPVTRDRALALLWPESDADRGRRLLSDTLYLLRGAVGEDVLLAPGDELRLNPERLASDVAEFERALDEGRTEAAVRAYGGPFLDGFHLAESAEFEQWVDGERARLSERLAGALGTLAEASEGAGDWTSAVGWWRRLAALEPGNGRVAARLMLALDAAGDRAGALQHARVHAALLREEYDAEPDPEVVRLEERLRRESVARGAGQPRQPGPPSLHPERSEGSAPAQLEPLAGKVARSAEDDIGRGRDDVGSAPDDAGSARDEAGKRRDTRRARRLGFALALVLVALAGIVLARSRAAPAAESAPGGADARRSIAVLPFRNLSAGGEQDYFSEGLAEELIGALSRIEGLRVAARTSSFAVGGRALDVRTIGDTLGVATVLEGSVRRDRERLRVSARLADAETGYQIWSEEYDRELRDVFAVQDEIARAIAGALEMRLAAGPAGPAPRRAPTPEAHDLYLRGVHVRNQLTGEALGKAVDYFDRAIQLDSTYALAYAGKATAIAPLVWYRHLPRAQGLPAMRAAARRALALDPTLGEAHVALGMLEFYFEWNWPAAEREFRRAIELNPSDQHAHHMYANYLVAMGRMAEAIAQRRRALELDPLSIRTGTLLGRDYFVAGEYQRAIEQYRRTMEMDSTSPLALGIGQEASFGLADVLERQGREAEAAAEYLRTARLEGLPPAHLEALRAAFDADGLAGYWHRRLALELGDTTPQPDPMRIASLYARVQDGERAAGWVERAHRERSMALVFLGVLPAYDGVRSHRRIAAVMERMGLRNLGEGQRRIAP